MEASYKTTEPAPFTISYLCKMNLTKLICSTFSFSCDLDMKSALLVIDEMKYQSSFFSQIIVTKNIITTYS